MRAGDQAARLALVRSPEERMQLHLLFVQVVGSDLWIETYCDGYRVFHRGIHTLSAASSSSCLSSVPVFLGLCDGTQRPRGALHEVLEINSGIVLVTEVCFILSRTWTRAFFQLPTRCGIASTLSGKHVFESLILRPGSVASSVASIMCIVERMFARRITENRG